MDPTQVDARYQIQFLPPGGGMIIDDFPVSTGPYTVPILLINNEGGLRVDDFQAVDTIRASLTQQGVIGTEGGQSLAGPFFLVGNPSNQAPPAFVTLFYSAVLQDGNLAFYVASDGAISDPNAEIDYENALNGPLLTVTCEGELNLVGGNSVQSDVWLRNNWTGSYLRFLANAGAPTDLSIILSTPETISLEAAGISAFMGTDSFGNPAVFALDGILPAFSVNGHNGVYGFDPIGNFFDGGICTVLGSGGGFGIGSPVSGGTPNEVLFTDSMGNLAQDSGFTYTPGVLGVNEVMGDAGGLTLDAANHLVSIPNELNLGSQLYIFDHSGSGKGKFKMAPFVPVALLASDTPLGWTAGDDIGGGFSADTALTRDAAGDVGFSDGAGGVYATLGNSGLVMTGVGANGSVQVLGTSGNTFHWGADNLPPASTQAVSAPALAYGQGTILEYLGSPDAWARISIGGTDYLLPAYLP